MLAYTRKVFYSELLKKLDEQSVALQKQVGEAKDKMKSAELLLKKSEESLNLFESRATKVSATIIKLRNRSLEKLRS